MAAQDSIEVEFPGRPHGPVRNILVRLGIAVGLILFVALLTYTGRDGYLDPEDDTISLYSGVFTGLSETGFREEQLGFGTEATTADQRILYDQASGRIFYDADGSGTDQGSVLFATVTAGTIITSDDFMMFGGTA